MMIDVKGISMEYDMPEDRIQSIKDYAIAKLKGKVKRKHFLALDQVSFSVEKGEVVGIIGHNGAGKSTLLKVIAGILKPTSGTVQCNGNIVPMLELGSGFDFDLSGSENIMLNGALLGFSKQYLTDRYQDIVDYSELGDFIRAPLRNYSSGMVVRLAFSIAALVQPEILILDEILAVGDENFQKKSKGTMLNMMRNGTTVLFVSHGMEQVKEICGRVIWLEHGRTMMIGDTLEVCPHYSKV
jgi:ABC-2 type transport system ATP-binding protein